MSNTVVLKGSGPAVRFKTTGSGTVRVVSRKRVTHVALAPTTDVRFRAA